jgi:glycolate oxidase iron-sulfur subunit
VGNIGCMVQIGRHTGLPVVHTVELLDWATGGPLPGALEGARCRSCHPSSRRRLPSGDRASAQRIP